MLASFFSWWLARLGELLPHSWINRATRARDGIVVDADTGGDVTVSLRRAGQQESVSLGAVARQTGGRPIVLRPPAEMVLIKHHIVPTAPRRHLDQLLRFELARITPFSADALFWRWDGHAKPGDPSRTQVTLTMVPKMALARALAVLESVGLRADFVEVGPPEKPLLLLVKGFADRAVGTGLVRGLAWTCGGLALIALLLPFGLQALALRATDGAIAELRPTIVQVEALRRGLTAGDAGRDILARETDRTGDLLQVLATITRILPDDTFLTDFSLRQRQMTLGGRSASAPRLITGLSADPAIRSTAFAAPVTRIEGATTDVFSIKAEVAR